MWSVLNIDARMLDGDVGRVRALLVDHTGCARSASELLAAARAAHREGGVQYCLVLPATPRLGGGHEGGCAWELHAVRERTGPSLEVPPGHPAGLRLAPAVEPRPRGYGPHGMEPGRQAGPSLLRCELPG